MHRIRSWARARAYGEPIREHGRPHATTTANGGLAPPGSPPRASEATPVAPAPINLDALAPSASEPAAGTATDASPVVVSEEKPKPPRPSIGSRFIRTMRLILLHNWLNVFLVFVPVGIAVHFAHPSAGVVFAMNAIAIIPLAGLLGKATETVAASFGDAVGALMNVTFGNAVELIIFIALVKNEIRIVQASLLGSILSNVLLILGMCFCLGGLRYREQIYNSTVTQMSACLLCLAVMSLLLPTAFHASFRNEITADEKVLQVSRGVSVILLLVYLLYLLFQLNSHAYLYESTPQHIIERETIRGPAAQIWDSSSDSDSSSSDSDSSSSSSSTGAREKVKRVFTSRRKKRDSDDSDAQSEDGIELEEPNGHEEGEGSAQPKRKHHHKRKKRAAKKAAAKEPDEEAPADKTGEEPQTAAFAVAADLEAQPDATKNKPFALRLLRPTVTKTISQNVFTQPPPSPGGAAATRAGRASQPGDLPIARRSRSMPEQLHKSYRAGPGEIPPIVPILVTSGARPESAAGIDPEEVEETISRTSAIILLLVSTGLVAVCAEFMVDSINEVVEHSNISEAFIGLILLPIVGNAAEHVTAVTVAMKNKMDLAIGVAVGSSIQIALFVTPLVVILGWILNKEMSLFFTLFETVSLFVSTFIVNFLVLDGRSNYLEGALLVSAYVIIAVAAFFYPSDEESSSIGGGDPDVPAEAAKLAIRAVMGLMGN